MNIFGWKSAGRTPTRPRQAPVPLSRSFSAWSAGDWPRHYEAQVRDGYLNNAVAQRAVRLVAEAVASAPLTGSDERALALVQATSGGQSLIETAAAHLLLHGNAFVEILSGADGAPNELYALRPERVTVEADARGWPVAFVYRTGASATRLPADSIIHIRTMHPLDDHYGLGCLGAASGAVAIHNAAARWNKALLDNAARPSGALVYQPAEGGGLSHEQFDRLKAELEASFQGSANAGRPMLLEGGLSWQAMSLTPADMDFVALKAAAAREIALAFGVPPMLLGLPGDATYANYREANKALWRQSILPLAAKICAALAEGLRPWYDGLTFAVELDGIPALSEDRERLWAQVTAADFLTPEEKRATIGLPELKKPDARPPDPPDRFEGVVETKFNPWHDTQSGQFTFEGQGSRFGGGGIGARIAMRPKTPNAEKPATGRGGFGGGGASGSWGEPEVKKPEPKPTPTAAKKLIPHPTVRSVVKPKTQGKKPVTKTISAGGYHFEVDGQGRTIRAYGTLKLEPGQPRSRKEQDEAGKPDRLPSDHGGHYIAREFGGPEIAQNHFAQDSNFNKSDYRKLELTWRKELRAGRKVTVSIKSVYAGNSKRPSQIAASYFMNGKWVSKKFPNRSKGQ